MGAFQVYIFKCSNFSIFFTLKLLQFLFISKVGANTLLAMCDFSCQKLPNFIDSPGLPNTLCQDYKRACFETRPEFFS